MLKNNTLELVKCNYLQSYTLEKTKNRVNMKIKVLSMSQISPINNSIYSDLQISLDAASGRNASESATKQSYDASDIKPSRVDLSNYYNEVRPPEDLLTKAGQNVVTSAHALDEAMVNALANGYTVQDICNIKSAEFAYKANCSVFKSTFEISV